MVTDMNDGEQSIGSPSDAPSYVCAHHAHTLTVWLLLMGCSDGVIQQRNERNFDSFFTTIVINSFITLHKMTLLGISHKMTILTTSSVHMLPTIR